MDEVKWFLQKCENAKYKDRIIELRKIVFKDEDVDKENPDFWDWEFSDNYAGSAKLFLAIDQETVVGHYAVCPSHILVDGEVKKGSIVVDVMTHPDYRFQGMFARIGKYSLDESGKDGIDFSYGFPIRKSVMPGHLKVGWKIAFPLPVYVYPISFSQIIYKFIPWAPLAYVMGCLPQLFFESHRRISALLGKRVTIIEKDSFVKTPELLAFIEKTKTQHRIIQYRDWNFLNWRYNSNHYRKYKVFFAYTQDEMMAGYAVTKESLIYGLNCTVLIDMQVLNCDKKCINALLRSVYQHAKLVGTALVGCMMNKNVYKTQLLKNLFVKSPYIFKFIVHQNNDMDYMDKLLVSENWFISWADTDDL